VQRRPLSQQAQASLEGSEMQAQAPGKPREQKHSLEKGSTLHGSVEV
jgi:hypothetical protein